MTRSESLDSSREPWPQRRCFDEAPHVGVVFVHGVGFQESGDTFADSMAALLRVIREATHRTSPTADPVLRGRQLSSEAELPVAEIAVGAGKRTQHWVLTEAWWARTFRPPSIGTMFRWLGPGAATARVASRLRWRSTQATCDDPSTREKVNELFEQVLLSVVITALLLGYIVLKLVFTILPLSALRNATIGPFERFITGWAGDMRILVSDEAQAAMIRARVADACREVQRLGCQRIIVVAHSGGAVASYMSLADPENQALPVAKLVTYGSGLNIAWRILGLHQATDPDAARRIGGALATPLKAHIANTWTDYWASDDPVPAGPVSDPPPEVRGPAKDPETPCAGVRVYNRLSLVEDHGTYLDNDEEFVIPLVNGVYSTASEGDQPPVIRTEGLAAARERRRQRVAALAMWRQFCTALAAFAVLGSIATGVINYWSEAGLGQPLEDLASRILGVLPYFEGPSEFLREAQSLPIDILSTLGYLALPALVVVAAIKIFPWVTGMRSLWAYGFAPVVAAAATSFLGGLLAAATAIAAPGLLAAGLASSPFWDLPLAQQLAARFGADGPTTPWILDWMIHMVLLLILFVLLLIVRMGLVAAQPLTDSAPGQAVSAAAILIGVVLILAAMLTALLRSPAFGTLVVGWVLIGLLAGAAQRIGRWRWVGWDRQERREARVLLAGGTARRAFGRPWDAVIFSTLAVGFFGIFSAIALRPWADFLISPLTGVCAGLIVLASALGIAFDAVNERGGAGVLHSSMNHPPI